MLYAHLACRLRVLIAWCRVQRKVRLQLQDLDRKPDAKIDKRAVIVSLCAPLNP